MRNPLFFLLILCTSSPFLSRAADVWIEAESFTSKGGWVIDQQFMDQMGSPYLLAHGMGEKVNPATTSIQIKESGNYTVYVRTYNWTSPFSAQEGPGKFQLSVNGKNLSVILGTKGNKWEWQKAGQCRLAGKTEFKLVDLSGFEGRCDAIFLTTGSGCPPDEGKALEAFRVRMNPKDTIRKSFDLVVVGGGIAGMCAAMSAARLGCKVALVHDRPVLGGNNSSEVRVHLAGWIEKEPYPELGNLIKEMGPVKKGNAQPAENYEDDKKLQWMLAEPNISLFLSTHATGVRMSEGKITAVKAVQIENGTPYLFEAPLFTDCTGDGSIGFWAGADYRMGREGRDAHNEPTAPALADSLVMGSSVQWYSIDAHKPSSFPSFNYGIHFNASNAKKVIMGEWTWETGMNRNQITEFERVRDYGMLVVYSNWSFLKNGSEWRKEYENRRLGWVAYIAGKRESRRLMGDYILTEPDIVQQKPIPDATASTSWTIDLHFPDPTNSLQFPGQEFLSATKHIKIHSYPIPYRCLYSRNIPNLFMAGRNISVSHVALGTTRVMRTNGMLGEVTGMAAALCHKHQVLPRQIYTDYMDELRELMKAGSGKKGLPNNQKYNQGKTLDK